MCNLSASIDLFFCSASFQSLTQIFVGENCWLCKGSCLHIVDVDALLCKDFICLGKLKRSKYIQLYNSPFLQQSVSKYSSRKPKLDKTSRFWFYRWTDMQEAHLHIIKQYVGTYLCKLQFSMDIPVCDFFVNDRITLNDNFTW